MKYIGNNPNETFSLIEYPRVLHTVRTLRLRDGGGYRLISDDGNADQLSCRLLDFIMGWLQSQSYEGDA